MRACDVFRATLRIDELVHIESEWTFCVYDDGTLTVAVQRPENGRERAGASDDLERLERERAYSYVSYDGVATEILSNEHATVPASSYTCEFLLAKCGPEGESWTVEFTATLSRTRGVTGHWKHTAQQDYSLWRAEQFEDAEPQKIPAPSAWSAAVEPVVASVAPLLPGSYWFEGSLRDDENFGFIVPISVELTLLADGTLTGSSVHAWGSTRDDGAPERAVLTGSWTRERLDMTQTFEFQEAPDEVFAFHGRVGQYQISGEWAVVALQDLGDWEDSEHQRFHLHVTKMQRPWTPESHAFFPTAFRSAARICLLSSLRATNGAVAIPSAVWPRVLAFCDAEWFREHD